MFLLARVINLFCDAIVTLICVEAIMSWFTGSFGPGLWKAFRIISSITEPFVRPFRKLLSGFSMRYGIDFSPVLAILVIELVARVLTRILVTL
ncbi:MAG: YggT family protein [Anaerovoracaceae bacterium]|jgi:YggT family protein